MAGLIGPGAAQMKQKHKHITAAVGPNSSDEYQRLPHCNCKSL